MRESLCDFSCSSLVKSKLRKGRNATNALAPLNPEIRKNIK